MYSIAKYNDRYKPTNKSGGDLKNADYVKLPVNPKGDGLQILLEHKRGLEVFAIWCLLLEKTTAQSPDTRGKILNHKDDPATIQEIAKSISLKGKEKLVEHALNVLVSMGWVILTEELELFGNKFRDGGVKINKDKINKDKINKDKYKSSELHLSIFNHWNKYKGKSVVKKEEKLTWKGHNLKEDGSLLSQIEAAIKQTLSKGYTAEEITGAIDNYAKVLLGEDYFWSYAWTLREFLMRGEESHKNAPRKWLKFLPDEFIEERWLTDTAKLKQANKTRGPTPYQQAKERIEKDRNGTHEKQKQNKQHDRRQ